MTEERLEFGARAKMLHLAEHIEVADKHGSLDVVATVRPHLISEQFIEHGNPSSLQRIQPSSRFHFSRDSRAHSIVTLVRDPRLSSGATGFE